MSKHSIKCECGAELPLVSDKLAMHKAIKAHAETHRHIAKDCSKTDAANQGEAQIEVDRIKADLMKKVSKITPNAAQ